MQKETVENKGSIASADEAGGDDFSDIARAIEGAEDLVTDSEQPEEAGGGEGGEGSPAGGAEEVPAGEEESAPENEEQEEQPGEKPEGEEDQEEEIDPKTKIPVKVQARIDGLTAENARLKTELTEAKEKQPLEPVVLARTPNDPLSLVMTMEGLQDRVKAAREIRQWCRANAQGGTVKNDKGEETEYNAEQVQAFLAEAENLLEEHAPQRAAFLQQVEVFDPLARSTYPDLFKKGSDSFNEGMELLKVVPEVLKVPHYKLAIGDYLAGRALRLKKEQEAATGKPGAKAAAPGGAKPGTPAQPKAGLPLAPKVASPAPKPAARAGVKNQQAQEKKLLESGGSEKDLAAALE